jgi:hypothetical protein
MIVNQYYLKAMMRRVNKLFLLQRAPEAEKE